VGRITKNYIYNLIYQLFVPLVTAPHIIRILGAKSVGRCGNLHCRLGYFKA
jgi:hypothetical protein